MGILVGLLAAAGVAALVYRLGRSAVRLALRSAEVTATTGLAEISARRGDLTGLTERRHQVTLARRRRRLDLLRTLGWLLWLALPAATAFTREAYALAAPLWLLPIRRAPEARPEE
jgi:hypothetical protein